ncbi:hypothetical protein B0H65DRAFT_432727, partial [Neurospora tetraspora]
RGTAQTLLNWILAVNAEILSSTLFLFRADFLCPVWRTRIRKVWISYLKVHKSI